MRDKSRKARRGSPSLEEIGHNLQRDLKQLVNYLDGEVVPKVRAGSSQALRKAAEEMVKVADYMDASRRRS